MNIRKIMNSEFEVIVTSRMSLIYYVIKDAGLDFDLGIFHIQDTTMFIINLLEKRHGDDKM
jgi:hypothetical protein